MKESKPWHIFVLILWRLSSVILVLCVLLALLIAFPNPILKPLILNGLSSRIPGEVQVGKLSWDFKTVSLENVVYITDKMTPSLKAKKIQITFELDRDFIPLITAAKIVDLNVPAIYNEKVGFYIEGLPMEEGKGTESFDYNLPPLQLENGKIHFKTTQGAVQLILNGTVSYIKHKLQIAGDSELSAPFLALKGNIELAGILPNISGKFTLNEFIVPQLFTLPIKGNGEFTTSIEEIAIAGNFSNEKLGLEFDTKTRHEITKNKSSTKVKFKLPNIKAALAASLTKIPNIPQITGGISGSADFVYAANKLTGGAKVRLIDISVNDKHYSAKGVNGDIRFDNLDNFSTPRSQSIQIQQLNSFVPLRHVKLLFQHLGNGNFKVQKAEARLEKGSFTTGPFEFESLDKGVAFELQMQGISAQYLSSFSKLPSLEVTGLVDGKMNVKATSDDFAIAKGGKLWITNPPGVIRYRPDLSKSLPHNIQNLTGNENPMDLALIALWNMHYSDLVMTLDKGLGEELNAVLQLKGKNPDAFSGHPFEFNINVSGETLRLIREALASIE